MSETTTNTASGDTLIHDSQLTGFSAFRESLVSKHNEVELVEKSNEPPSYINQALEGEKQARKDKLEVTQATPRSGITSAQTRSQINTPISKTEISTITKPSPSTVNTKNNRKESDETTDSSDEESSSDDDKSSDSDNARAKRPPINHANKRR
ncbi:unnamed protein product [Rotaria sordida]|uniref:Uncharacterized protein n=1 Tax=Rotaria sordida TaxID=392033 RepID=A0A814MXW8_9BILA|nr:unnamed protein product [Rotaria sordida]